MTMFTIESINSTNLAALCNKSHPTAIFEESAPPIPPPYLQAVAAIVYTLLSILTVGGNALVCIIVFHYMGVTTVTNLFIANLAITDVFIGLFCIPIVFISDYLISDWPFGTFMCKFTSFAQSVFVVCTVYTLIAMSVDRYIAIIHPLKPKLTRKQCRFLIGLMWLFAILFSLPICFDMNISHICFPHDLTNQTVRLQTVCRPMDLQRSIHRFYNNATITIIYLIPLCILSIIYIRLGCQLYRSRAPGEAHSERDAKIKKSKHKVIKMCCVVVIMFGVCWLPMQLYNSFLGAYIDAMFDQKYLPHIFLAFHFMAMSNSCVNPVIYGVMSSKFRDGYLHYWHYLISCGSKTTKRFQPEKQRAESMSMATGFGTHRRTYEMTMKMIESDVDRNSNACLPGPFPLMLSNRV